MPVTRSLVLAITALGLTGLVACDTGSTPADPGVTFSPPEETPPAQTPPVAAPPARPGSEGLVVHEWGTYTSLQASDGTTVDGLHHEEEALPPFVAQRCMGCGDKGFERLPEPVTQKLETPVLYFYSDTPVEVDVEVGFPDGIISEYYPAPEAFLPEMWGADAVADGWMRWTAAIDPAVTADSFPWVPEDDIWAPSRRTAATPLRIGDETERFIFYRGLGRFEMPVRVTSSDGAAVTVANTSDEALPAVFLMNVTAEGAGLVALGGVEAHSERHVAVPHGTQTLPAFVADAKARVHAALVATGLFDDEAQSMVDTWERSYFQTPGLRLLYVAPRAWTDALLPITVTPQPVELVRTLVGRVEIMTAQDERALLAEVSAMAKAHDGDTQACLPLLYDAHGRLMEARLRAAARVNADASITPFLGELIEWASGPFYGTTPPGW